MLVMSDDEVPIAYYFRVMNANQMLRRLEKVKTCLRERKENAEIKSKIQMKIVGQNKVKLPNWIRRSRWMILLTIALTLQIAKTMRKSQQRRVKRDKQRPAEGSRSQNPAQILGAKIRRNILLNCHKDRKYLKPKPNVRVALKIKS